MIKKRIFVALIVASLLRGCGKTVVEENADQGVSSDGTTEEIDGKTADSLEEATEQIGTEQPPDGEIVSDTYGSDYGSWQEAYAAYVEENFAEDYGFEYAFIYLDNDEQPELYIDTMVEAGGEQVLTYYDDKLNYLQLSRMGSTYIEKEGLIYNNCGHMDWYPVNLYKLYRGDFYQIGEGIWGGLDWENGIETDENGELDYQYEWEGERYSEEDFYAEINKLFVIDDGIRAEDWYNQTELLSMLRTGHHTAYGHTYEIITGDMTWNEAKQACIDKGGYLATITSPEERRIITEQIEAEGKENYSLYVGYQAFCRINGELQDEGWIEKEGSLVGGHAFTNFDYYFDPGYDHENEEWDSTLGQIGLMKYSSETNKIYKYEAPMDLLSYAPQYAGKLGYICEFE